MPNSAFTFDARGLPSFGNVIRGSNLTAMQTALQATGDWALNRQWQLKVKVTSGYTVPLSFGFPGGNGFFNFTVPASASDHIIELTEMVKDTPGQAALEYRSASPKVLSEHSVMFSDICLRQVPCAKRTNFRTALILLDVCV